MNTLRITLVAIIAALLTCARTHAQNCTPDWTPGQGIPGVAGTVRAMCVFDPPGEQPPVLVVGGSFEIAGDAMAHNIAAWDGRRWSTLGAGVNAPVYALTVFDDGSGPALFVGGAFSSAGGIAARGLARWNGLAWSALGSGISTLYYGGPAVEALAVYDDGTGGGAALYAAGGFSSMNGVPANSIARWSRQGGWSALGAGITGYDGRVSALVVYDDGSGPTLYVGGQFNTAGATAALGLARWNGTTWSTVGAGLVAEWRPLVYALTVFDDGTGSGLYVGGNFTGAGEASARNVARWDGAWSALGPGFGSPVSGAYCWALAAFDDGSGPALYVGGAVDSVNGVPVDGLARWNGSAWSALGPNSLGGFSQYVRAMAPYDDGSGPALFVGGDIYSAAGEHVSGVTRWHGQTWSALGGATVGDIADLAVYDDGRGGGPALYAGGAFTKIGGVVASGVARWNGASWSALDWGTNGPVLALLAANSPAGPVLYAGGAFSTAGNVNAANIARWNGLAWSPLGSGIGPQGANVYALATVNAWSPTTLYVGGYFSTAGGATAANVAKWNGLAWSSAGIPGSSPDGPVTALLAFNNGAGAALYAGGYFNNVGSGAAKSIARFNGTSWTGVGSGLTGTANALAVFGGTLYAGGTFGSGYPYGAGYSLTRWNGLTWTDVESSYIFGTIQDLVVFDDGQGGGPALYAAGSRMWPYFSPGIARWNGTDWTMLGQGLDGEGYALATLDSALYVGGSFTTAGDHVSVNFARWACPAPGACFANCDGSTTPPILNIFDFSCFLSRFAAGNPAANCDGSTTTPILNSADFICFINRFWAGCP